MDRIGPLLFALGASLAPTFAHADAATMALEAFYATCLAFGPDYDRTMVTAELFGWKPLTREGLALLAPTEKPDMYQGWIATGPGYPQNATVAVTKAHRNGVAIQTCTLAVLDVNAVAFVQAFVAKTHPVERGERSDGVQALHTYRLTVGTREQIILIVIPHSAGKAVIASSVANEQP